MKRSVVWLALFGLLASGCIYASPPNPPPSMTFWGPTGGFAIGSPACAGKVVLSAGSATVNDPCFTGVENVVLCTNTTSATAVRCHVSAGSLRVEGVGGDVIAYARVR
jgi:hypothetical protein